MKDTKPIIIDEAACNGCGRCIFICSMGVIDISNKDDDASARKAFVAKPEYCMYCEACVIDCRRGAIKLNAEHGSMNIKTISELVLEKKRDKN